MGGRAVVLIAHTNTVVPGAGLGQSDIINLYNNVSSKAKPAFAPNVTSVVRDTANDGLEAIFANWLTNGYANSLSSYTITPSGVTMYNATSEASVLNYVSSTPNSIGFVDWAYLQNNLQSATNIQVIPVLNKQNGALQTPTTQSIQAEIINMNNNNYDAGLCRQLYYITNGQPASLVSNYIKWAFSPESTPEFNSMGLYSATNLGLPTNVVTGTSSQSTLTVFAAASLYNSFNAIKTQFQAQNPGVDVIYNFDSSGNLETEIKNGATPDVFASAGTSQMTGLEPTYVSSSSSQVFCKNALALIVPISNPGHITSFAGLQNYEGDRLIICAASVPCGQYALNMLSNITSLQTGGYDTSNYFGSANFTANFLNNVASYPTNVNNLVADVALGQADGGICYQSDVPAQYQSMVTVIPIPWWDPADTGDHYMVNQLATYPIAPLAASTNPYAQSFVNYVMSSEGQSALQQYGLLSPSYTVTSATEWP
jgi:molybdate transport system substrate-binding protein